MDLSIKIPVFTRGNDGSLKRVKAQAQAQAPKVRKPATSGASKGVRAATPEAKAKGSVKAVMENWIPHARVKLLVRQKCGCCREEVEYLAGDLIEYGRKDRVGGVNTIRTRAFNRMVDARYAWEKLPLRVDYLEDEVVDECGKCLRLRAIFDNTLGTLHDMQMQYGFNFDAPHARQPAEGRTESAEAKGVEHA